MNRVVYQIRNKENEKVYIGSTVNLRLRWQMHKTSLRGDYHYNYGLQKDFNEYGLDAFVVEVLADYSGSTLEELRLKEKSWIVSSGSILYGYNQTRNTATAFDKEEVQQKIKAILKVEKKGLYNRAVRMKGVEANRKWGTAVWDKSIRDKGQVVLRDKQEGLYNSAIRDKGRETLKKKRLKRGDEIIAYIRSLSLKIGKDTFDKFRKVVCEGITVNHIPTYEWYRENV